MQLSIGVHEILSTELDFGPVTVNNILKNVKNDFKNCWRAIRRGKYTHNLIESVLVL
jgi:hypothetical protein